MMGVRSAELGAVIDFLHKGESTVGQESLNNFLDLAKRLRVIGLSTSRQFLDCPDSFYIVRTVSGLSGQFLYSVRTVFGLSGQYLDWANIT